MAVWLWCFVWYSFLGYLLEKAFAAFTDSPRQTRKGFWLLPLCPVYGLAMLLILWQVPNPDELPLGWLIPVCAVLATMTEYGVDWWYDTFFGVRFWDYSGQAFQLNGRVCLCFSLIWGVLATLALRWIQPVWQSLAEQIPPLWSYLLLLVLTADSVCSGQILRHSHDTERLSWR